LRSGLEDGRSNLINRCIALEVVLGRGKLVPISVICMNYIDYALCAEPACQIHIVLPSRVMEFYSNRECSHLRALQAVPHPNRARQNDCSVTYRTNVLLSSGGVVLPNKRKLLPCGCDRWVNESAPAYGLLRAGGRSSVFGGHPQNRLWSARYCRPSGVALYHDPIPPNPS
jgi:hypothetical protein